MEVPEDAGRLRERLRLSNEEHERLSRAARPAPDLGPVAPESDAKAFLYAAGETAYRERVLLAWVRSGASAADELWRRRLVLPERWQPPRFPIGGADVMALGVPAGPRVGQVLRALKDWWIAGDFGADEVALRTRLEELVTKC